MLDLLSVRSCCLCEALKWAYCFWHNWRRHSVELSFWQDPNSARKKTRDLFPFYSILKRAGSIFSDQTFIQYAIQWWLSSEPWWVATSSHEPGNLHNVESKVCNADCKKRGLTITSETQKWKVFIRGSIDQSFVWSKCCRRWRKSAYWWVRIMFWKYDPSKSHSFDCSTLGRPQT